MSKHVVSTVPAGLDLVIYQGDDFRIRLGMRELGGTPVDLTGATARAQIRRTPADAEVVAEFVCAITGPGDIDLHLPHDITATLTGDGAWDCQVTYPSGDVTTMAYGAVHTTPEVTRG